MTRRMMMGSILTFLLAVTGAQAASTGRLAFESRVLPNVADQVIAGELGSAVDWAIRTGQVAIHQRRGDKFSIRLRVRGLVIPGPPFFGTNPSPDFLARLFCHDSAGEIAVAATTRAAPLSPEGNGFLFDLLELPDECFAPIVLIGGSSGPPGRTWFAVSGF